MSSFSDYLENKLLDHVFGGDPYTAPATHYIAAYTVAPTDAGGGTEVTGGSYARVALTNNATNFPAAAAGAKANGAIIAFPTATADWGTIVAIGIHDALTGGNLLGWCTVTPQAVPTGVIYSYAIGDLDLTLD